MSVCIVEVVLGTSFANSGRLSDNDRLGGGEEGAREWEGHRKGGRGHCAGV
jgi:hypothetical protein